MTARESVAARPDLSGSPNPEHENPVPARSDRRSPENPASEAVRTPSPFLHPSGKPTFIRLDSPPAEATPLDEDPLQPLHFNPEPPPPSAAMDLRFPQGDRHGPESVIGMSELLIGIVGIRRAFGTADPGNG